MSKERYFGLSPRIARWKLDTTIENWLAFKADDSIFFRFLYLMYYAIFDRKYYLKGREMAYATIKSNIIVDEWNLAPAEIVDDMIFCLHRYGISFQDYVAFDFPRKSPLARNEYISDKLRYHYCDILNKENIEALMTDKFACYQAYNQFYKRDLIGCYNMNDSDEFIKFCAKHTSFIYKPLDSHSGKGIEIINTNIQFKAIDFFNQKIKDGPFVVEELIQQGTEMARLHPSSINTLRVVTFRNGDNVDILLVLLRVGIGNSIVDNGGAGGLMANVSVESGVVDSKGVNFAGAEYILHPDTKVPILGYQIPQWAEAKEFVAQLVKHVEGTTFISWDIAYCKSGWCLVEANDCGAMTGEQMTLRRGLKKELFVLMDKYFAARS